MKVANPLTVFFEIAIIEFVNVEVDVVVGATKRVEFKFPTPVKVAFEANTLFEATQANHTNNPTMNLRDICVLLVNLTGP